MVTLDDVKEAIKDGKKEFFNGIVKRNEINAAIDESKATVFSYCVVNNAPTQRIKYLIDNGADVNVTTDMNETPLFFACGIKNKATVKVLLDAGADVNIKAMPLGSTPLILAVEFNLIDIVRLLLAKKADVNITTSMGIHPTATALHYAVKNNNASIVKLLLEAGADVKIETVVLFSYALMNDNVSIFKMLVSAGANLYQDLDDDAKIIKAMMDCDCEAIDGLLDAATIHKKRKMANYFKSIGLKPDADDEKKRKAVEDTLIEEEKVSKKRKRDGEDSPSSEKKTKSKGVFSPQVKNAFWRLGPPPKGKNAKVQWRMWNSKADDIFDKFNIPENERGIPSFNGWQPNKKKK